MRRVEIVELTSRVLGARCTLVATGTAAVVVEAVVREQQAGEYTR